MTTKEIELLTRAADKLQDYCAELNGDLNDSLADEISQYLGGRNEKVQRSQRSEAIEQGVNEDPQG